MSISNTSLTTSPANLIVSSGTSVITTIYIANYSPTANATFYLYAVPSGDSVGNSTVIYSNLLINPNDTYVISTEKLVLENGDRIVGTSNASTVLTATVSYTDI